MPRPADASAAPAAATLQSPNRRPWIPTLWQLTLALALLGLIWRTYRYAVGLPIWGDEAFVAVDLVLRDFASMFEPLTYRQIVPLGFMWAELAMSRILGLSEWALHLLPFLAGVAGLLAFRRFAWMTLPRSAALLATGIFAGSYFVVRHSAEVKPYSGDLLISLSLTMLGWSLLRHPRSVGRWIGLIAWAPVAIWLSYPSMFVSGGVGLMLTVNLLRMRFRPSLLLGWLIFGVLLCGSALAMYQLYAKPHAEAAAGLKELQSWQRTFPPITEPWYLPQWFYEMHTGNLFAYPQGGKAPGSIATFALFVIGAVRMWRTNRQLLFLLLSPFLLNFIAAAMKAYPYGGTARISQHLAPAICMLAGLGWSVLLRRFLRGVHRRRSMLISAAALAIIPIGDIVSITIRPYKEIDDKRGREAVRSVAERTGPNDQWVIFNAHRPVDYAPFLGDWHGTGGQFVFDVLRFAPVPVTWAPPPESVTCGPGQTVWLIAFYAQRPSIWFPEEQLNAYVETLVRRLGPHEHESLLIKEEHKKHRYESLEVYRFDAK